MMSTKSNLYMYKLDVILPILASRCSCGEKKCAYLSTFGISSYFQSLLLSKVKSANEYVLLFDESLNSNLQSKQPDIHIHFLEGSQFYTSEFLSHADADCLHEKLLDCCTAIVSQVCCRCQWMVRM